MAAGRPKAVLEDGRAAGACRAAVSVCSARTLACETAARERDCAASEISIAPSVSLQLPCRLWLPSVPPSSRVLYLTLSRLTRLSAAADRSKALLPTFTARLLCYAFCSPQPSALLQASFPPVPPYCRRLDFGGCCVRRASGCILDGGHVRSGGRLFPCARDPLHCSTGIGTLGRPCGRHSAGPACVKKRPAVLGALRDAPVVCTLLPLPPPSHWAASLGG